MTTLAQLPISGKNPQNLSSPDSFFQSNPEASADDAADVAAALLDQASAGLTMLLHNGQSAQGFSSSHAIVLDMITAVRTQIELAKAAVAAAGGA